jgi:Fur family ferric uptake transcriptional regulator
MAFHHLLLRSNLESRCMRLGGTKHPVARTRSAIIRLFATLRGSFMAVSGIKDSLKQQGVRLTRQRRILLDLIDQSGQHLDAERLYQLARERDPKINRVTVYRTLKLLKAGGLVDELDLMHHDGDQHYYETRLKQEHAHVICLRCGKIEEFFGDLLQQMREQIESHFGFKIVLARTEVGGYCSHCQVLRAKEMAEVADRSRGSHA